jgi:hypothetical protein
LAKESGGLEVPNSRFHGDPMVGEHLENRQGARLVKVHSGKVGRHLPASDECEAGIEIWHHPRAGADADGRRRTFRANGLQGSGNVVGSETFISVFISRVHVDSPCARFHRDGRLASLLARIDRNGRMFIPRAFSVDRRFQEHDEFYGAVFARLQEMK